MKNKSTYRILFNHNLILTYLFGKVEIWDIKALMRELVSDSEYSKSFDMIVDLRDCQLSVWPKEVDSFFKFIKSDLKIIDKRKVVFLANNPNKVVIVTLYSDKLKMTPIRPFVFSTLVAALECLNINMSESNFEKEIQIIKSKLENESLRLEPK